jgi:MFS family permease
MFQFLIFTIVYAVSNSLPMLTVFRFLAGCAGSTPITLGGASIGDVFPVGKRGASMALWGMGPLQGPVLGPIIGGYEIDLFGSRGGYFFGIAMAGKGSVVSYRLLVRKDWGKEERLPSLVVSAPLAAGAFFWYGWSADSKTNWIVPILGTVVLEWA